MGRLENFIPKLDKFKIKEGGGIAVIQFDGQDAFPIEQDMVPFLNHVNGHMSLREIFLFLNQNDSSFSINKSLETLK